MIRAEVHPAPPGSDLLTEAFALRRAVFVEEQGVPEDLELDAADADPATRHLVGMIDGRVLAAVRWVREPAGYAGATAGLGDLGHLQRMAVAADSRGTGMGARLVAAVEAEVAAAGLAAVYLAAQHHAVGFYERCGYVAYGEPFVEAGIDHRHMLKALPAAGGPDGPA